MLLFNVFLCFILTTIPVFHIFFQISTSVKLNQENLKSFWFWKKGGVSTEWLHKLCFSTNTRLISRPPAPGCWNEVFSPAKCLPSCNMDPNYGCRTYHFMRNMSSPLLSVAPIIRSGSRPLANPLGLSTYWEVRRSLSSSR